MDTCSISAICSNVIFMTAYKCSLLYCRSVKTDFSLSSIDDFFLFLHPYRRRNFPTFQSINHMVIIPPHCYFRLLVICIRPCFPASKLFFAFKITLRQNNLVCRTRINNRICDKIPFSKIFLNLDIVKCRKKKFLIILSSLKGIP